MGRQAVWVVYPSLGVADRDHRGACVVEVSGGVGSDAAVALDGDGGVLYVPAVVFEVPLCDDGDADARRLLPAVYTADVR